MGFGKVFQKGFGATKAGMGMAAIKGASSSPGLKSTGGKFKSVKNQLKNKLIAGA